MEILTNLLTMLIVVVLALLAYSYRQNGADFNLRCWIATNVNRFAVGAIFVVGLAVLQAVSTDIDALLQVIGFNTGKTPIALGLSITALLIMGVSGNQPREPPE